MTTPLGGKDPSRDSAHTVWDELAVGYALSALEPGELARFEAHLHGCRRCARSIAQAQAIGSAIGSSLPAPEPSAGLRDRVMAAAERARPSVPERHVPPSPAAVPVAAVTSGPRHGAPARPSSNVSSLAEARRRRVRRAAPWLVSAAAAVVIAVLAVSVVGLTGSRNSARTTAAARSSMIQSITHGGPAEIVPLKNNDGKQVATVVAHDGDVSVLNDAMATNPTSSSVYVLWGLTSRSDPNPTALGTFDVRSTTVRATGVAKDLRGSFSSTKTFAISLEKGRVAPAHPTAVVALGSA